MMFREFIFGRMTEGNMQKIILLIVIFTLSIECRFQEPNISTELQGREKNTVLDTMNIDAYTLHKVNTIIQDISNNEELSPSEKISLISARFLGTPYQGNRLYGSDELPEELVVDFRGLDCFTYLDYVVALHTSHSQDYFLKTIVKTRYINGDISFYNRKHFFTDWANREHKIAEDITAQLSPCAITRTKSLNEKAKDKQYLPGVPIVSRRITYLPSSAVDNALVNKLKSGDLIGIYTPLAGLDVSHVGFFIMTSQGPVFRHASSSKGNQSVVDSPFIPYLSKYPGIIVLRVKTLRP